MCLLGVIKLKFNFKPLFIPQNRQQGSYRHYSTFFQDFPGLVKTKFQGFPGLKKLVFKDFPGYIPFSNTGCMRSKKCTYQISYRCNCITVNKPKCSTCNCIDPRGGKMHTSVTMYYNEFLIYFAILKLEIKISRTTALEFQNFPGLSRVFKDLCLFPGLSRPGNLNN